jgi:hypothetical protein
MTSVYSYIQTSNQIKGDDKDQGAVKNQKRKRRLTETVVEEGSSRNRDNPGILISNPDDTADQQSEMNLGFESLSKDFGTTGLLCAGFHTSTPTEAASNISLYDLTILRYHKVLL